MPPIHRVAVGFAGGASLSLRLDAERLAELRAAVGDGGWHELEAEDGRVSLYLSDVVYVREEADGRVGFARS